MPTNPELIKLCKFWDKLTEKLMEMELYSDEDYDALRCKMEGDKAELRIGSVSGHRAHVFIDKKELEYYDENEDVDKVIKRLMEDRAGAICEFMKEDKYILGVRCKDIKDLEETFKVLAFATSMDLRIENPTAWYGEEFEMLDRKCWIEDKVERELCAVNKLLEKLEARLKRI